MVAEISLGGQVKKLIEMQKLDGQIYKMQQDLIDKPKIIENLKNEFEATKAKLNEFEERSKLIQVQRKESELNLKTKEDMVIKANSVLSELKTNKEYTAKITEIESLKADKSIVEEKILISFDETDLINKDIDQEKDILLKRETEYLANKSLIEAEINQIELDIKDLQGQRNQRISDIDPKIRDRYQRILNNKEGLAITPVIGAGSCGGCYMTVTTQMRNQIKQNIDLVACEFCMRILYLEDEIE